MSKVFLITVAFIFSIQLNAQQLPNLKCEKGFKKIKGTICVQAKVIGDKGKRYHHKSTTDTKNKTYTDAQQSCRRKGAHVCTVDEIELAWDVISDDIERGEMIGNYIGDDHHLCVNNSRDKMNFEGPCHKHYKYSYRCCADLSPIILMLQTNL